MREEQDRFWEGLFILGFIAAGAFLLLTPTGWALIALYHVWQGVKQAAREFWDTIRCDRWD